MLSAAYGWVRRHPLLIFFVMTATFLAVVKWGYDKPPIWFDILYFVLSSVVFSWIDNQLPRRRYRSLTILFLTLFVIFVSAAFRILPAGDDSAWILAILIAVTTGYGGYCIWRWHRQIVTGRDILQQREHRSRRSRKTVY